MEYVAMATLLLLLQYMAFTMTAGLARGKGGVSAPAVTGDEMFERALRVQINTLEQLAVTLPALWISGYYFNPEVAAILGLTFFLGRLLYRMGYMKDPAKRAPGMIIGFLSNLGLVGTAAWGLFSGV
jgi:glutathione S-transferase